MSFESWTKINNELLGDRALMHIISSENITVGKVEIMDLVDLPTHSHINEQITIVTEGEMNIQLSTVEKIVRKGEVCIIPANISHSVKILKTPFKSFDIFYPIRENFTKSIEK